MGIDFLAIPIDRAKTKTQDRGIKVEFLVANALELREMLGAGKLALAP